MLMAGASNNPDAVDGGGWDCPLRPPLLPLSGWPGSTQVELQTLTPDLRAFVVEADGSSLITAVVPDALDAAPIDFQRLTAMAYRRIGEAVDGSAAPHLVRFWNFIPGIRREMGSGLDAYMVFNAGRFAVYHDWFGDLTGFEQTVPTGTGVGHSGRDLVIHALSTARPGLHIDNPRQAQSFHYSAKFGPLPPCFARASWAWLGTGRKPLLLIGGTAAIRGEHSFYPDDPEAQTVETLANLEAVTQRGSERLAALGGDTGTAHLARLRVYVVRAEHREVVLNVLRTQAALGEDAVEVVVADLCRPELLVEIEAVAELASAT